MTGGPGRPAPDEPASPVRQLARVVSLAARVEPELLRAARLALLPNVDASAEADLWFSSLVQSRTPLAIVLRVDVLEGLRTELARDRRLLDRAWDVIDSIHEDAAPVLKLEERLTWLGLRGNSSAQEVDELLRSAVSSMVNEDRDGIARWSARAFERLPPTVRALESARMLNVGAKARLGRTITEAERADAGAWLAWVLPTLPQLDIGVRLLEGAVEVGAASTEGAHLVKVPATNPPYVEVSWQRDGATTARHVAIPQPVQPVIVATETRSARITTALGQTFELARRQRLATGRAYGLRGRIVAMDDAGTVIPDGVIYVKNETIFAVQAAEADVPSSFQEHRRSCGRSRPQPRADRAPQPPRVRCTTRSGRLVGATRTAAVGRRLRLPRVRNGACCRPSPGIRASRKPSSASSRLHSPGGQGHHVRGESGRAFRFAPIPPAALRMAEESRSRELPSAKHQNLRRVGPRTSARRLKVARPCSCALPKVRTIRAHAELTAGARRLVGDQLFVRRDRRGQALGRRRVQESSRSTTGHGFGLRPRPDLLRADSRHPSGSERRGSPRTPVEAGP